MHSQWPISSGKGEGGRVFRVHRTSQAVNALDRPTSHQFIIPRDTVAARLKTHPFATQWDDD